MPYTGNSWQKWLMFSKIEQAQVNIDKETFAENSKSPSF